MQSSVGFVRLAFSAALPGLLAACIPSGGLHPGADAGCTQPEWVAPKPEDFVSPLPCGAPDYPATTIFDGLAFETKGGELPPGVYDAVAASVSGPQELGSDRLVVFDDHRFIRTKHYGSDGRAAPGTSQPIYTEYSSGALVTTGTSLVFANDCSVIVKSATPLEPEETVRGPSEEQWDYGIQGCSELLLRRERDFPGYLGGRFGVTYRRR